MAVGTARRCELAPHGLVGQRLAMESLDVDFLAWLEGPEDRLPRVERLREIEGRDFAAAVRAVAWLRQFGFIGGLIAPGEVEEWRKRYATLFDFLVGGLAYSMASSRDRRSADLKSLEGVLEKLLPRGSRSRYDHDIRELRKHGQPPRVPAKSSRRSGGRPESEETRRMRAAVEYMESGGASIGDLADFWTECAQARGDSDKLYDPENIRSRLRKGPSDERERGAGELEFWRAVYGGEFRIVFPGRFPLSAELKQIKEASR